MDINFKNRKVVITGVSEGIGKSLAMTFAEAGAKVAGSARNSERLYAIEREISGTGHFFFSADFSNLRPCGAPGESRLPKRFPRIPT